MYFAWQEGASPGWSLHGGMDTPVHTALFYRDALGLMTEPGVSIPPRLAFRVPDRRDLLDDAERLDAAAHWVEWWTAVLADVGLRMGPPGGREWFEDRMARAEARGAGPEYRALANRPALQKGLVSLYPETERWMNDLVGAHSDAWTSRLPWKRNRHWAMRMDHEATVRTAQKVAEEHDVPLAWLRGQLSVVVVEGVWWHPHPCGIVLHSPGAAGNPETAAQIARAAFEADLDRRRRRNDGGDGQA